MDIFNPKTFSLVCFLAVFSAWPELAISHPVDIEMTKRAYEQLKLANREALAVSRGDYVDNRESPYAMNVRYEVEGSDGGGSGGPVVSDPADFSGAFGSATVTDEGVYTWPSGAEAWGGFANNNSDLYPFSFPHGGRITFDASIPEGGSPAGVRFVFENAPYPDVDPWFSTDTVTVVGSEDKPYSVQIPAQFGIDFILDAASRGINIKIHVTSHSRQFFFRDYCEGDGPRLVVRGTMGTLCFAACAASS